MDHRYLWSTRFVVAKLRSGALSERAVFGYFLTVMTFDWLQFTAMATLPAASLSPWSLVNAWLTFVITVAGLIYLYVRNGSSTGRFFLNRYFPLSVTVGWKFVAVALTATWLLGRALSASTPELRGWVSTAAVAIVNVAMFMRIGAHLSRLSDEASVR